MVSNRSIPDRKQDCKYTSGRRRTGIRHCIVSCTLSHKSLAATGGLLTEGIRESEHLTSPSGVLTGGAPHRKSDFGLLGKRRGFTAGGEAPEGQGEHKQTGEEHWSDPLGDLPANVSILKKVLISPSRRLPG